MENGEKGLTGSSIFTIETDQSALVSKLLEASQAIGRAQRGPANTVIVGIETMEEFEDIFDEAHHGESLASRGIRNKGAEPEEVYKALFNSPSRPRNRELKSLFPEIKGCYEIGEELASIYLDPQRRGEWLGKRTGIL